MKDMAFARTCFRIITASCLLLSAACSDPNRNVKSILSAADALVMSQPEEALDTLQTIDASSSKNMNAADKALYDLLITEARFKNFQPIDKDSAIFQSVNYYRQHGPDDKLSRALIMQGAVYQERNELSAAMESFKEAEPILEQIGDKEQLGLLHTRIGETYQFGTTDVPEAIKRYREALRCFEAAGDQERIMNTYLSLARVLLSDSTDVAESYLKKGLEMAISSGDKISILSGYDLYSYLYRWRGDYSRVINIGKTVARDFGETPKNPTEAEIYMTILYNCIESYAFEGQVDSARYLASILPLQNQYDSLVFYAVNRDIATAEGDWREAFDCQREAHRIEDEMKQASYDAQLVEVERKYENSVLREQLYERNNRILVLVLVYAGISLAAAGAFLLLRRLLRRQKAEIDHQAGIVRELHDTASRLERDLRSKASEADALKAEKQQEEEARRDLEAMLTRQSSSNQELMRYYGKAQKAMRDIVNIYDARSSNPRHFMDDALEVARGFIVEMNSPGNATTLIETAYPGFLERLFEEFPGLSEEDRHLIILTCCGYPNGAVCTILGISESNLAVRKTRLAHRMGIDTSLAKFLRKRLVANPG